MAVGNVGAAGGLSSKTCQGPCGLDAAGEEGCERALVWFGFSSC